MSRPRERYGDEFGPPTGLHRHEVDGGWMVHQHPVGNPDYEDSYREPHAHLIVLGRRNYVWEDSGPMAALEEQT